MNNILYSKTLRLTLSVLFAFMMCLPTADAACYDTDGDGILDTCDANLGPVQRIRARSAARQTARAAANNAYVQSYSSSVRYSTPSRTYTTYSTGYGSSGNYASNGYGSSGNYARYGSALPYGIELAPGEVLMSIGPAVTTTTAPATSNAAQAQPEASGATSSGCRCPQNVGPRLDKIESSIKEIEEDISNLKLGKIGKDILGPNLSLDLPQSISGPKLALSSNHPASSPGSISGPQLTLKASSPATFASL